MSKKILLTVALGILLGRLGLGGGYGPLLSKLGIIALNGMIFLVAITLGANEEAASRLKTVGIKALLPPFAIAFGSIAGAAFAGLLIKMNVVEAMAVGAGFGWYSFSGVVLQEMVGAQLGATAFLSNVMRELLAVISIPSITRRFGKLSSIAPGGATSMDTSLPIIAQVAGLDVAALGFLSGIVLSFLVPVIVPLLAGLL